MHAAQHCLTELVTATSELSSRRSLRSASSQRFEVPRTKLKFGERSFSFAGPTAWNAQSTELPNLLNIANFKKQLKTYLFQQAFSYILNCNAPLVTLDVNGAVEIRYLYLYLMISIDIGRVDIIN